MRILQICNKSPYPPKEGGSIAMNAITQGLLKAGCSVKVLAVSTPKFIVDVSDIPESYLSETSFESCFIDTRIRILPALKCFLFRKSYHVERFKSDSFAEKIKSILENEAFDVIQLETLYMAPYLELIRKYAPGSVVVLRAHNVEHLIWDRITEASSNPLKKFYLKHLAATLREYEISIIHDFDGIAAISDVDADFFGKLTDKERVVTIPFGIEDSKISSSIIPFNERPLSLFHLGSMDWIPNLHGVKWFLNNVMPLISAEFKSLKFELAGRNMPVWVEEYEHLNVVNHGEVDDAADFMNKRAVMIVPLLSGSGIRIKIIEGMAAGNVIISTPVGAEGIDYVSGENILIASSPEEFVNQISFCVNNPEAVADIAVKARESALGKYSMSLTTAKLAGFYKQLIAKKRGKD